jgi:hypothetical protein
MNEANKPRIDAWDATLTEEQRWKAYDLFRKSPWYAVAKWAADEFSIQQPSRSSLYRWAERMRKDESAHRIEQSIQAREEVGAMANTVATDSKLIDAYKSLATDLALKNNAADAVRFTTMALAIAAQSTKQQELDLKKRAQDTKDEALRLAREKFEAAEARLTRTAETLKQLNSTGALSAEARAEIEKAMGML